DRRIYGVGQTALLADLLEQPRAEPATDNGVQHRQRPSVFPVPAGRADTEGHMGLFGVTGAEFEGRSPGHPSRALARNHRLPPTPQPAAEVVPNQRYDVVVVDVAG